MTAPTEVATAAAQFRAVMNTANVALFALEQGNLTSALREMSELEESVQAARQALEDLL